MWGLCGRKDGIRPYVGKKAILKKRQHDEVKKVMSVNNPVKLKIDFFNVSKQFIRSIFTCKSALTVRQSSLNDC